MFKQLVLALSLSCAQFNAYSQAISFHLKQTLEHDPEIFTQGAVISRGKLYESGGRYNQSALYVYEFPSLKLLQKQKIADQLFAEGLALVENDLYLLTWKAESLYLFNKDSLTQHKEIRYQGEGWGLTLAEDDVLIKSNGSAQLEMRQAGSFELIKTIDVEYRGQPIINLNELEFIHGIVFANVWQSSYILAICPSNGMVVGAMDLTELAYPHRFQGWLNGIAWWQEKQQMWITGKNWDKSYLLEVTMEPIKARCSSAVVSSSQ